MKRYVALLLGAVVCIGGMLAGCGKPPEKEPPEPEQASTLSVYVVQSDALYTAAVNSFQTQAQDIALQVKTFPSYKAMLDEVDQAFASGTGPDVVLYNSRQSQVDGQTLAQSGHFLSLDDFAAQLDSAVYPTALMEAGKIAGKQYFIPFSYSLIYAYTSEQLMADAEYSPADSVYEIILAESEALTGVLDRSPTAMNILRPDPVNGFFEAAGIQFFDKHTGVLTVDKAALAEICRFVKSHYENMEKRAVLYQQFAGDFAGAPAVFSFITENYAFMNNLRFYQSMIPAATDSSMIAMPYHKLNDPQVLCPSIVCFGGINANTKVPEQAYRLLKYILDYPVSNDWPKHEEAAVYDAPVSLAVFEDAVSELASNKGYGPETITALTLEHANQLMEGRENITDAVIPNATLGIKLQAVLEPYFMGKDSFDSCYNVLLNELQLYLEE